MLAFNYWLNESIVTLEGEELCPKCEGKGVNNILNDRPAQFSSKRVLD